jgi:hypothetical protein
MFAGCVACVVGFTFREHLIRLHAACDPGPSPDSWRRFYTPKEVREYFDKIGSNGRDLYARTQLTLDLLFPLFYAGFLAALTARLGPPGVARFLIWLPVAAALMDVGENVMLAHLARRYNGAESGLATMTAVFTVAKWILIGVALIGLLICGLRAGWHGLPWLVTRVRGS